MRLLYWPKELLAPANLKTLVVSPSQGFRDNPARLLGAKNVNTARHNQREVAGNIQHWEQQQTGCDNWQGWAVSHGLFH
ncbi:hypothetical protein ETAA8_71080 [Anatilimnocola aggregata]|uniref:Uncharacterized protein n=1 Tax=Anatilimnocola aggregata TaxID=2528021 RepID=A0A517YNZ9_9BACT|nr:hypothetical protein ETAA8_71080 [Anatilimnocola aggregata]